MKEMGAVSKQNIWSGAWRLVSLGVDSGYKFRIKYLTVHKKNANSVVFDSNADEISILKRVQRSKTMLMGYFESNSHYPEAWSYLYLELPEHFVWNRSSTSWISCQ